MKFRVLYAAVIAAIIFSASGCALIFSPARQYVHVSTTTPGAAISFDGDSIGRGSAHLRLSKYKVYNTFTAEKEGFKSRNYCVALHKYSPTVALAALDVAAIMVPYLVSVHKTNTNGSGTTIGSDIAIIPGLFSALVLYKELHHVKTHRYDKDNNIPALVPYKFRLADEKYLLVNNTAADIPVANQELVSYRNLKKYHNKSGNSNGSRRSYAQENLKLDNTVFTGTLNASLKKMRFVDTSGHIFPNVDNSLYLNATIKKITFHEIWSPYASFTPNPPDAKQSNHLFSVELAVDWDVLDFYKQKLTTIRTVETSDLYTVAYGSGKSEMANTIYKAVKDNMELSIINLRTKLEQKGMLKNTVSKPDSSVLEISRPPAIVRTKDDFKKSCVAIKTDDGSCSGTIVSEDGYILTSFHATLNTKKITVLFSDSTTAEATVIRKNASADVALLKINKTGLTPFILSEDTDPEIGIDVWAVGIVVGVDKEASLSHGIISGVRKTDDMVMLQTDASLNPTNSGGALVSAKGVAVGLVSMKLAGRGVEGIGFALSAHDIMKKLQLKYK